MLRHNVICTLLALFLVACTTQSVSKHPDFSGRWIIDKVNTKLQFLNISSLQRGIVVIEHHEPTFKFTRTFTVTGKDNTFSYELTTDGKEVVTQSGGQEQHSRLYWDGDQLVFVMRIVAADGESTNTVHYMLIAGGSQLQGEESFRGSSTNYDNLWILTGE